MVDLRAYATMRPDTLGIFYAALIRNFVAAYRLPKDSTYRCPYCYSRLDLDTNSPPADFDAAGMHLATCPKNTEHSALNILAMPPEQDLDGGWTPVDEQLPPRSEDLDESIMVLVCNWFGTRASAVYNFRHHCWDSIYPLDTNLVTHWKPLPAPPNDAERSDTLERLRGINHE